MMEKPYVDVVAQYREDKPRAAGHLFVYSDGRQVIAHDDAFNPDAGPLYALAHFVVDDFDTFKSVLIWSIVGAVLGWSAARRSTP